MLLNRAELDAIFAGTMSILFRRWRRPSVKSGGTLKTAIGVLAIGQVAKVAASKISADDAARAGFESRGQLLESLDRREGDIYRIEVRYAGADPRIALREHDQVSDVEFEEVQTKLERLDAASQVGPWTVRILKALEKHPHLAAESLAAKTGDDKPWLKLNVRKLKNLGLTISHHPGYELSPRGIAVLKRLKATSTARGRAG